jgi:segregation and condensation protein A
MNIEVNDFNGPLDLLLHLIKANKMDIYDINIELITKEYIDYINSNKDLTIDASSEYLVMASELIHLKSRVLLNNREVLAEEEYSIVDEEDLQRRLIEYQKLKNITDDFRRLEEKRSNVYTRAMGNLNEFKSNEVMLSDDVSLSDLLEAFQLFLKRKQMQKPVNTTVTKKELSVEERCQEVRNILRDKGKVNFFDLFEDVSKPYVIVTFLSILDMTKNKEIVITQQNNFGEIYIERSM